jgi:hypothetical protein
MLPSFRSRSTILHSPERIRSSLGMSVCVLNLISTLTSFLRLRYVQANVGDTSPNTLGAYCESPGQPWHGQSCEATNSTCGGKAKDCHGRCFSSNFTTACSITEKCRIEVQLSLLTLTELPRATLLGPTSSMLQRNSTTRALCPQSEGMCEVYMHMLICTSSSSSFSSNADRVALGHHTLSSLLVERHSRLVHLPWDIASQVELRTGLGLWTSPKEITILLSMSQTIGYCQGRFLASTSQESTVGDCEAHCYTVAESRAGSVPGT